ncbi:trimeric LpxA-like protein [Gamsiella multidivaricata]|uniref:trimeric LpxA-like protein n=1 Tax=Gamsiella multidivaricata TaxID=101098 RepID=UPI00221F75E7|nr:trimeric LpxA-like protein [Gamsiella multidivaricata]KAI7823052.1 trimeric LpxA-like protein [Gamsiella multidivaricata]
MMTRPRLTISTKALVCQDNDLRGNITVGAGTVLHPQCKVWATGGSIIFGSGNIVEENAVIINRGPDALIIGDNNVFEVGSVMEGAKMGNRNTLEVRSQVKSGTWLGDDCVIGTVCSTHEGEVLEDKTVIYGENNERRIYSGARTSQSIIHARHLEYLMQTLPKFNHSRTSS